MKIEATHEEVQALAGLLDAAAKYTGIRGAAAVAHWARKLDEAANQQDIQPDPGPEIDDEPRIVGGD